MLFNSIEYLIFFPIVFLTYWLLSRTSYNRQNAFLILVSYIFYGWWDWRFLGLIVFSSLADYLIALKIQNSDKPSVRKHFLWLSCFLNLGILRFFKYFNFFKENFDQVLNAIGFQPDAFTLDILLPVGISFYTFQTLSYTIDVYRKDIESCKEPLAFFCYVSFFPQLVAGPIERAKNLLPQFTQKRYFDYKNAVDGSRQILFGFFKKVVIADNCAFFLNPVFENYEAYDTSSLIMAAVLFSFQIYGDFSGYSDIAIGTSKLFGIQLKQNFSYPYFSRDIAEFWRRWHISLSTWFKDYLYIPLGGSRGSKWMAIRNVFIIFLVSGLWHGANWTFIFWGLLNAIYFLPSFLFGANRKNLEPISGLPNLKEIAEILLTFSLTTMAWILFRSKNITAAFEYYQAMIFGSGTKEILLTKAFNYGYFQFNMLIISMLLMLFFEWKNRTQSHGLKQIHPSFFVRTCVYLILCQAVMKNFFSDVPFIYFQF